MCLMCIPDGDIAAAYRVFGYSEGPLGAHAEYMTIPRRRRGGGHVGGHGPRGGRPQHRRGALSALVHLEGEDPRRARRLGQWRDWSHRLSGGPVRDESGCSGDRGLRPADVTLVMGLGACRIIDYEAGDFTRDGRTYVVVLDAVAESSFGRYRRSLKSR